MSKKDVAAIVSGAGWIGMLSDRLTEALLARGCSYEDIHGMVKNKVTPPIEKIADELAPMIRAGKPVQAIAKMIIGTIKSLLIDRSEPFNPEKFIGNGWTIWKGPADGNGLEGEEEQDQRSLVLSEFDLTQVRFEDCLEGEEKSIVGEERLKRHIAASHIRLDAKVFQTFWENKHLIPESYKELINGNTRFIYFFGTTLRNSRGNRYVLCLCWRGGGWDWNVYYLDIKFHANHQSAVLASEVLAS